MTLIARGLGHGPLIGRGLGSWVEIFTLIENSWAVRWAMTTSIQQTASIRWAIQNLITQAVPVRWSITDSVMQTIMVGWSITKSVANTFNVRWGVLARILSVWPVNWRIRIVRRHLHRRYKFGIIGATDERTPFGVQRRSP